MVSSGYDVLIPVFVMKAGIFSIDSVDRFCRSALSQKAHHPSLRDKPDDRCLAQNVVILRVWRQLPPLLLA